MHLSKRQNRAARGSGNAGFSLVELLIVILVIGVITAFAIMAIKNVTGNAKETGARHTAKVVVSMAAGAQAAGDETIANAADKEEALDLISAGVEGSGIFEGVKYRVELSPDERNSSSEFIVFGGGKLLFSDSDN